MWFTTHSYAKKKNWFKISDFKYIWIAKRRWKKTRAKQRPHFKRKHERVNCVHVERLQCSIDNLKCTPPICSWVKVDKKNYSLFSSILLIGIHLTRANWGDDLSTIANDFVDLLSWRRLLLIGLAVEKRVSSHDPLRGARLLHQVALISIPKYSRYCSKHFINSYESFSRNSYYVSNMRWVAT